MENKNTIIALVLMLVVWFGFSILFPPQKPQAPVTGVSEQAQEGGPSASAESAPAPAVPIAPPVAAPVATGVAAAPVKELVVETDKYTAVFSNSGARLKYLQLKEYKQTNKADSELIELLKVGPEHLGSLRTLGTEGFILNTEAVYNVSVSDKKIVLSGDDSRTLTFSTVTPAGIGVEKIFTFHGNRFDIDLQMRVTNQGSVAARGGLVLSLVTPVDDTVESSAMAFVGATTLVGEDVNSDDVDELKDESKTYGADALWTSYQTKYFMSAIVPLNQASEKIRVQRRQGAVENQLETPYQVLNPGDSANFDYLLYFGPRDIDVLEAVNYQLAKAIDFGFFSILAKPLLHVLKFFYSFLGNWGVAIILVTVIIKLIFWPLTQKSYSSMKAMQKLQPEMAKLREKYKNDKQRLNMEIMSMYKENRVNPMGGCLPMLVQIPVFFALYKVLLDSIELRHAPFALWITDLSAKDPYYVTPLIMGATMFIQQKMTPTSMDPNQAKMFMLMPVIFTFMFLNFPSGLVLYWLVNNVLTIGQQYYINKKPS